MRIDISDFVASSLRACRPFVFLVFLWATQPEITRLMIGCITGRVDIFID